MNVQGTRWTRWLCLSASLCLLVGLGIGQARAESTLFVIVSDDHPLDDLEAITPEITLPVVLIDLDEVDRLVETIREPLAYIQDMPELEFAAHQQVFRQTANKVITEHRDDVHAAFVRKTIAGELASRFEVEALPAVIELAEDQSYRFVERAESLYKAVVALEPMPYYRAPRKLGKRGPTDLVRKVSYRHPSPILAARAQRVALGSYASDPERLGAFERRDGARMDDDGTPEPTEGDRTCLALPSEGKPFGTVSRGDWGSWVNGVTYTTGTNDLSVVDGPSGQSALRQRFTPNNIGSPRVLMGARLPASNVYRISQSVFLESGWDWGGPRYKGGKIGFGLGGGTTPSGGIIDPAGFTARFMWRGDWPDTGRNARIAVYSYAADRGQKFGKDEFLGGFRAPIGQWFEIEMEVTVNSSVGSRDGRLRGWVNGALVLDRAGIGWQTSGGVPVIDRLFYSSFYGGGNSEWSPDSTTYARIADVCWQMGAALEQDLVEIDGDEEPEIPVPVLPEGEELAELEGRYPDLEPNDQPTRDESTERNQNDQALAAGLLAGSFGDDESTDSVTDDDTTTPPDDEESSSDETSYSVLDAMVDGSSPSAYNCLDLSISGVCVYVVVRVYVSITGISVEVSAEASLELTHSNPELLVTTYRKLGGSPLEEAELLYSDLQTQVSGAAFDLIDDDGVPADYHDEDRWASTTSTQRGGNAEQEGVKPKVNSYYHEVEAIGHPGTIYSYLREGENDFVSEYTENIQEAPGHMADGVGDATAEMPGALQEAADQVVAGSATLTEGEAAESEEYDFVGQLASPNGVEILELANAMFDNQLLGAAADFAALVGQAAGYYQTWQSISNPSMEGILTESGYSMDELGDFQGAIDAMAQIEGAAGDISVEGLGGGTDLYSFCPNPTEFMKPYLASGFDMIQWRFNLPEMIYPQTYAPPIQAYADLYVGDVATLALVDDGDGNQIQAKAPNAWGSIYPRQGVVFNIDGMKAAAVTAARAAHVVTREGQPHVYSPIPPLSDSDTLYLDITPPEPYSPADRTTGKWQLLAPELEEECYAYGEDDTIANPWTKDRQSEDGDYVWALWRQSSCCPEPEPGLSVAMIAMQIGKVPLDIQVLGDGDDGG